MDWIVPAKNPPIPTFSIMNADSIVEDESKVSSDLTNEQILTWYKNMLTGEFS
jgi:2-oxoisovalerate dehydrogenase E1 component alpha subunit